MRSVLMKLSHVRGGIVGGLLATSFLSAAPAAAPQKAIVKRPAVAVSVSPAQRLWAKLLTKCGDDYFYAGSIFDGNGMLSDVQVGHQKLMEYRGVKFNLVPIRVTEAERANGLEARMRISMMAHLYREQGEQWSDGPGLNPRNIDDILGQVLSSATADMFDMGGNGAMAMELVKFKGEWNVARRSVDSSSSLAMGGGSKFYILEKLIALPMPRYNCGTRQIETTGSNVASE